MQRQVYEAEHEEFRASVRAFIEKEISPHSAEWNAAGIVSRDMFRAAGEAGLIGFQVPEEYGGGGAADFRFNAVLDEELAAAASGRGGPWADPA